ncbi:MAG: hypothetical protein ACI9AR_000160 [Flavobacteriaceae bacterium]|jgi:hypothetical protein
MKKLILIVLVCICGIFIKAQEVETISFTRDVDTLYEKKGLKVFRKISKIKVETTFSKIDSVYLKKGLTFDQSDSLEQGVVDTIYVEKKDYFSIFSKGGFLWYIPQDVVMRYVKDEQSPIMSIYYGQREFSFVKMFVLLFCLITIIFFLHALFHKNISLKQFSVKIGSLILLIALVVGLIKSIEYDFFWLLMFCLILLLLMIIKYCIYLTKTDLFEWNSLSAHVIHNMKSCNVVLYIVFTGFAIARAVSYIFPDNINNINEICSCYFSGYVEYFDYVKYFERSDISFLLDYLYLWIGVLVFGVLMYVTQSWIKKIQKKRQRENQKNN